jgi:hypothetical protein
VPKTPSGDIHYKPLPISALLITGFWLAWPWPAPHLLLWEPPGANADLLVVLGGTPSRFAAAQRIAAALPAALQRLLIRCPGQPVPAQAIHELLQGFDTATQITALAQWLQRRQRPLPKRVWIATDPHYTAHTVLNAQIALGHRGIQVGPPPPPPGPIERRKLLRDAFHLQLWLARGSTGAWLAPERAACKRVSCDL